MKISASEFIALSGGTVIDGTEAVPEENMAIVLKKENIRTVFQSGNLIVDGGF